MNNLDGGNIENITTHRSQTNEILFVLLTETVKSHCSSIACIAEKNVI